VSRRAIAGILETSRRKEPRFVALTAASFNALVTDHAEVLYRMAFRLLGNRHAAEDVVQETFRSAWRSRARYSADRGSRAWLATILRRRVADYWRQREPHIVTLADMPEKQDEHAVGVESYTDEMQHALQRLPLELRETLLLVVVGELTHHEAAEVLGCPLGTVLSRVSRARAQLREHLLAARR
jgi:RNA polymerase sigma-70 factor (ECF subfamily)